MFQHDSIIQLKSNKNQLDLIRPFIAFPLATSVCFFYFLFVDISNFADIQPLIRPAILFAVSILISIAYCYIEYINLSANLEFIVTKQGIIRKNNKAYSFSPWNFITSISKWSTPVGWEINIESRSNQNSSIATFVINNINKPFYLKNTCDYYLDKIYLLKSSGEDVPIDIPKNFKPWKYIKQRIFTNLLCVNIISILCAGVWFYFS